MLFIIIAHAYVNLHDVSIYKLLRFLNELKQNLAMQAYFVTHIARSVPCNASLVLDKQTTITI